MERTVSAGAMDSDNIALRETAKGDKVALTRKAAEGMACLTLYTFSFSLLFFSVRLGFAFYESAFKYFEKLLFCCCWYEHLNKLK